MHMTEMVAMAGWRIQLLNAAAAATILLLLQKLLLQE